MAVPDFQTFMGPILESLTTGEGLSVPNIRAVVAEDLGLTDDDQQILLPSGKQTTFSNRVAWALTHMGKAGLAERPARGQYTITDRGRQVLTDHPERVDLSVLGTFPEYVAFRAIHHDKPETAVTSVVSTDASPSEAIGALVEDSNTTLAADLLERVLAQPPVFLETLALLST